MDHLTNTKIGDNNTILVVVETKETKRLARSGPWKDQLIVMLTVRPEYPNADIEEGVTISTGDENTIWLEAAEPDDPSTNSGNDMHIEPMNGIIEIEDTANKDDAMGGYPYDLIATRLDPKAIRNGWVFGNGKARFSPEEGGNCESLSASLKVWPSMNTPTFKGCTPRHPHDPEYRKEDDQREYIAISSVNAGSTYTGGDVALFTVNGASVGRLSTRSYVKVKIKSFMQTSHKEILFVRLVAKPMTYEAESRKSLRYADGHIVVFGTVIHRQEHQDEEPLMLNVGVTLNSLLPEHLTVSQVSEMIYLPDSGLGGEALRKQLQGPIRTSFIQDTASGDMFNLMNIINLTKKGENLPLCCMRIPTKCSSGPTKCSSKRNRRAEPR